MPEIETPADLPPERNAFELLSKPTLSLTDAEVEAICIDLRQRRERFLQGIADKPPAKPRAKAVPKTAAEKKANTEALLAELDLGNIL